MNDPHSHTPQASGCGCSGQSTTEPAAATVSSAPAACCSGGAAEGPPETAKNDEHHPQAGGCCAGGKVSEGAATVTDPVCGMTVDPAKTAHHAEHAGQTYHFCSAGCRTKFVANPNAYLGDKPKPEPTATPGAIWTCPMHPQIRQEGPGTCPICGMALEPEEPSLDDGPNPELVDFTRRLWVAGVLAVPLLAISMVAEMLGIDVVSPAASPWVQLALSAPIVLWAGWPFFQRGWTSLRTRHLNMFTLISIRGRCRLPLQPGRDGHARHLPPDLPHARRCGPGLLRGGRSGGGLGAARTGPRTACQSGNRTRDPRPDGSCPQDGAPGAIGRVRGGSQPRQRGGR